MTRSYAYRCTNDTVDKSREMYNDPLLTERYHKWKEGINPRTNRKIKIGGKTYNTIKNDSLLKSKSAKFSKSSKSSKSIKNKLDKKTKNKNKKNKTKRIIDKYCSFYKTDINGKINKKLFLSCKLNKYCRKYKCKDIDYKMIKLKKKQIGLNYNTIIFG